jgi:hypothetical protein
VFSSSHLSSSSLYLSEFPLPRRKPALLTTFEVEAAHA